MSNGSEDEIGVKIIVKLKFSMSREKVELNNG